MHIPKINQKIKETWYDVPILMFKNHFSTFLTLYLEYKKIRIDFISSNE